MKKVTGPLPRGFSELPPRELPPIGDEELLAGANEDVRDRGELVLKKDGAPEETLIPGDLLTRYTDEQRAEGIDRILGDINAA
jgi:hypothetical protein